MKTNTDQRWATPMAPISLDVARRSILDLHSKLPIEKHILDMHLPHENMNDAQVRDCYGLMRSMHRASEDVSSNCLTNLKYLLPGLGLLTVAGLRFPHSYEEDAAVTFLLSIFGVALISSTVMFGIPMYNESQQNFNAIKERYINKCTELIDPEHATDVANPLELPPIERRVFSPQFNPVYGVSAEAVVRKASALAVVKATGATIEEAAKPVVIVLIAGLACMALAAGNAAPMQNVLASVR